MALDAYGPARGRRLRGAGFCAALIMTVLVSGAAYAQENFVPNPGFEGIPYPFVNLVDGVDGQGRLKLLEGSSVAVMDFNNDGKKDIVAGEGRGLAFYYLNEGTNEEPKFSHGQYIHARFNERVRVHVTDWNEDGRTDLLLGGKDGWVFFLKNGGTPAEAKFVRREPNDDGDFMGGKEVGTRDTPRTVDIPLRVAGGYIKLGGEILDIGQYSAPAVADWNGDGMKDLILGEGTYGANSVYALVNSGSNASPRFERRNKRYIAYGEGRTGLSPFPFDWNGDGLLDLLVGDSSGRITLHLRDPDNLGSVLEKGKPLKSSSGEIVIPGASPTVVDWDEDGDQDILCGSSDGFIYLCINEGSRQQPKLKPPVRLTGSDLKKDTKMPGSWLVERHGRIRSGAYTVSISDEVREGGEGGARSLALICLDKHVGYTYVSASLTRPLEPDARYEVSFWTKARPAMKM